MKHLSTFHSTAGDAQYIQAYEAVLKHWPVRYDELNIPRLDLICVFHFLVGTKKAAKKHN